MIIRTNFVQIILTKIQPDWGKPTAV